MASPLDLDIVRAHFPAFDEPANAGQSFFENAGGSFACRHTIDALTNYYTATKVQPYAHYATSAAAGEAMDRSRLRWAQALGVEADEVIFGPSTSINTYVLAHAFGGTLRAGDEVIVTNQDHEANTGAVRAMAERVGCTVREWRIDPQTGLLDTAEFESMLSDRTRLVTVPHASNIVGQENDIATVTAAAHRVGARVIVDGVSFAPHTFPNVATLDADVYLFSLYKTYSVHQGLMVVRNGLLDALPNQGHFFNAGAPSKRLNPAGPDHAQVAAADAVLDYVTDVHLAHGGDPADDLRTATAAVSRRWRAHEDTLTPRLLDALARRDDVRVIGPTTLGDSALDSTRSDHRCPTIAFDPLRHEPDDVARELAAHGVQASAGHFYAHRVLDGLDVDPDRGVVRLSFVHYTSSADIDRAIGALDEVMR